jgi:hypothetical protein
LIKSVVAEAFQSTSNSHFSLYNLFNLLIEFVLKADAECKVVIEEGSTLVSAGACLILCNPPPDQDGEFRTWKRFVAKDDIHISNY